MAQIIEVLEMLSTQGRNRREDGENSQGRQCARDGEDSYAGERSRTFGHRHVKLDFPWFNGEEDPTKRKRLLWLLSIKKEKPNFGSKYCYGKGGR
jgi:hypothetical protein